MNNAIALDESVVFDLNRHFSRTSGSKDGVELARRQRPDAGLLVEAVSNAALALTEQAERVRHFELKQAEYADLIDRMKAKLEEMMRFQQTTQARVRSEIERADRAENQVSQLQSRVRNLEADLDAAMVDLHQIADVINNSLAATTRRQDWKPEVN